MIKMYDYLIVGAGLFGSVFAHEMTKQGKKCLVIDRRNHIGGNIYTEEIEGINVHMYGAHIFHTDDRFVWEYMNSFAEFNRYTNSPIAIYNGEAYNLPFNMNTFSRLWNITKPEEAVRIIEQQKKASGITEPKNLEEQAISLVGYDIYKKLIEGYTQKQWGKSPKELPCFIIKRLPVRFTYDNNYFDDKFQGIPIGGYTKIIEKMLQNCDVQLNTDYFEHKTELTAKCRKTVFTGALDSYFEYCYGKLEYRSLLFETEVLDTENYQGNAVVNYTDLTVPYTRIIEHKHFEGCSCPKTVITKEYPSVLKDGMEPYYPVNDEANSELYRKYAELAKKEQNVIFGGRLGTYRYLDMHHIVKLAYELANSI